MHVQVGRERALREELQQARAAAEHAQQAQRRAEGLQAALDSARRAYGTAASPPAATLRPSPARPSSAPLRRPATAFSLTGPDSRGGRSGVGALSPGSPARSSPLARDSQMHSRASVAAKARARPMSALQMR